MKFFGNVGYGIDTEVQPGRWEVVIQERAYAGDVLEIRTTQDTGVDRNDDINISNSISIIADQFAYQHFQSIRYVEWYGTRWKVRSIKVEHPRLIISLGGVYNGPKPKPAAKHT